VRGLDHPIKLKLVACPSHPDSVPRNDPGA
jgi:hypothetical protein